MSRRLLSRQVVTRALRDFASSDPQLRADVSDWITGSEKDFDEVCRGAGLQSEAIRDLFSFVSGEDLTSRRRFIEDAVSVIESS